MRFKIEHRDDENSAALADRLQQQVSKHGWKEDPKDPQLIFCIGGDGTILRAIHNNLDRLDTAAFLGIHTGTLGFLTDYTHNEIDSLLKDMEKEPEIEEARLLEITLPERKEKYLALNEVRIETLLRTLNLDVYIDSEFFEHMTGSGLCICTQSGSTAVNRALNGAVIDPGLQALQLTEIMPISHKNHHTLSNPYVMNAERTIRIQSHDLHDARLSYDHMQTDLQGIHEIDVRSSDKRVRFARYRKYPYLKRLKNLY